MDDEVFFSIVHVHLKIALEMSPTMPFELLIAEWIDGGSLCFNQVSLKALHYTLVIKSRWEFCHIRHFLKAPLKNLSSRWL